jgi:GNAT superfamily N-acetyltransferase
MAIVSNEMGAPSIPPTIYCRAAAAGELKAALGMALGAGGRIAPEGQVVDFLKFAEQRGIDVGQMRLAELGSGSGKMLWAVLPIVSPGRTMLLLAPPRFAPAPDPAAAAAGQLTDLICRDYGSRDVHLAQVLIDPAELATQTMYSQNGFVQMAELIYLHGTMWKGSKAPKIEGGMKLVRYSAASHGEFAAAILRTYVNSLDCPALSGLRDIEDVIIGHKATGEFDPNLWFLLSDEGGKELGVLLLSRSGTDALELVYLGLASEARGKGLAGLLMQHAAASVIGDNRRRLTLAVDSRNGPALKLYYRHGLQRIASKVVMLRDLRNPPRIRTQN